MSVNKQPLDWTAFQSGKRPRPPNYQDLTGRVFGRLTCLKDVGKDKHGQVLWLCRCACGNEVVVRGKNLSYGTARSCGCLRNDLTRERMTRHGFSQDENGKTPRLYGVWLSMKDRCSNPNYQHYAHYGGRGITVCDEWRTDYRPFHDWAMANGYREDLTIDRIDNDGNYEPGNCRWATRQMQNRNASSNHLITHNGETRLLVEWSELLGVNPAILRSRLRRGWSVERTLTAPVMRHEDKAIPKSL